MNGLENIAFYFTFPFVRYALIVGVFISLSAALLGVPLVLKRFSFIGDGLSHVAFCAMAISAVMNLYSDMIVIVPVTVISAIIILRAGQNTRIRGDAAIAMLSVSAMAIGYLLMNIFTVSGNVSGDVCSTLFGSVAILTLSKSDVWLCIAMSILVIAVYTLFYNKLFAVTFDENFAEATGVKSDFYNTMIAVITAIIIVLAMKLVGTLLISALVIFPALSAMRLFKSFKSVIVFSAIISVACSVIGILASILASTPVGSTIVVADLAVFAICSALGKVLKVDM
jgi:zinc transport system permease protein